MATPRAAALKGDRVLAGILLLSLALKLLLALWAEGLRPRNDEYVYSLLATRFVESGQSLGVFRPPGYLAFLAGSLAATGSFELARVVQALLSTASAALVYAVAVGPLGVRVARLAAGLSAFDPVLVSFSHLLFTETLFVFCMLAALACLLSDTGFERRWRWAAAGLFSGLAAYVRPQILTLLPLLLAWAGFRAHRKGRLRAAVACGALLAVACTAVLLPWTAWQRERYDRWVLVSNHGPFNLLVGSDPSALYIDKDDHWKATWGQLPGGGYAPRPALVVGWLRIVSRPLVFVRKSVWEAAHLYTLDSFALRHLRNGWYGEAPDWLLPLAVVGTGAFSALLIAGGGLGVVAQPASPLRAVAGLTLLHATLLFGVTYSLSRYCVPLRPLLAVGAAWLCVGPGELRGRFAAGFRTRAHAALALAGAALLALSWWNDAPLLWDMLVNAGRDHRFRWIE